MKALFLLVVGFCLAWVFEIWRAQEQPLPPDSVQGNNRYLSASPKSIESEYEDCRKENRIPVLGPGSSVVCLNKSAVAWEH